MRLISSYIQAILKTILIFFKNPLGVKRKRFWVFLVRIFPRLPEYREILPSSPYSDQIRENTHQKNSGYWHFSGSASFCKNQTGNLNLLYENFNLFQIFIVEILSQYHSIMINLDITQSKLSAPTFQMLYSYPINLSFFSQLLTM